MRQVSAGTAPLPISATLDRSDNELRILFDQPLTVALWNPNNVGGVGGDPGNRADIFGSGPVGIDGSVAWSFPVLAPRGPSPIFVDYVKTAPFITGLVGGLPVETFSGLPLTMV